MLYSMKSQFDDINIIPTDILTTKELAYSIEETGWFKEKELIDNDNIFKALFLFNLRAIIDPRDAFLGRVIYYKKKGAWIAEVPYTFSGPGIKYKDKYKLLLLRKKDRLRVIPTLH